MAKLPTADQMLANADASLALAVNALNDAADWLRSDWTPVGSSLTSRQAARRLAVQKAITKAKAAIEAAQRVR